VMGPIEAFLFLLLKFSPVFAVAAYSIVLINSNKWEKDEPERNDRR
jgi:hypothetical protein